MAWKTTSPFYSPPRPATKTVGGRNVTKFCVNCGRELKPRHLFCPGCGTKHGHFELVKETIQSNCGRCGHRFENGATFCSSCGGQADRSLQQRPVCDCGAVIAKKASYCGKCGKRYVKTTPATNPSP